MKYLWRIIGILVLLSIIYLIGYNNGKKNVVVDTKETVRYIYTESIRQLVKIPEVRNTYAKLPLWIYPVEYRDTVYIERLLSDTAAVYDEFIKIRHYDDVLLDDSTGYIRLSEYVQYNSIFNRTFEVRPIVKEVLKEVIINQKSPFMRPYIDLGYGFKNSNIMFGGGVTFRDKISIGAQYQNGQASVVTRYTFK